MRIWDIHPGYLNRQSLLGEHRELHGIASIIINGKKGYSRHPETLRWMGHGWALTIRHKLLAAEMALRNFNERTPLDMKQNENAWPVSFIDSPKQQFSILTEKYRDKEQGRIPLAKTAQQLWSHHKYSVLARDPALYREIGKTVASMTPDQDFTPLCQILIDKLREPPGQGGLRNAIQHMWGHISQHYPDTKEEISTWSLHTLFTTTQKLVMKKKEPYLLHSTALSELAIWL